MTWKDDVDYIRNNRGNKIFRKPDIETEEKKS